MEAIFHEQQEGSLCAQHCLNSLLQGQFYSAVDLGELATELDTMERRRMAEHGEDSAEFRQFIQQPSSNMDDSGFFSVQVISRALSVWGLELVPLNSSNPAAVRAKASAIAATAYICNYREHWFTIRRLGSQWFNLNSLLEGPELVSNTYLGEFLAQLQQEGYSIFLVTGNLPECDADLVLQAVPAVQTAPPRLLSDVPSSGAGRASKTSVQTPPPRQGVRLGATTAEQDEAAEIEAAMMMSLAETSGTGGQPAQLDSETLNRVMAMQREGDMDQEEQLELALRMSQQQEQQVQVPLHSEEDEMQQAIALSLAGTGGPSSTPSVGGPATETGWGARLAQQEEAEERMYREEAEKAAKEEEEQLRQALAMSMDIEESNPSPSPAKKGVAPSPLKPSETQQPKTTNTNPPQVNPVNTAWPKTKNPAPGTLAAGGPSSISNPTPGKSSIIQGGASSAPGPSKMSPVSPKGPPGAQGPTGPSGPTSPSRPSISSVIPGPGHTLGGDPPGRRARPGAQEDPQEIRRRRLAFLDKMQKEQKEKENQ